MENNNLYGYFIGTSFTDQLKISKRLSREEFKILLKHVNKINKFEFLLIPYLSWTLAKNRYENFKLDIKKDNNTMDSVHYQNYTRNNALYTFEISSFLFSFKQFIDIYLKILSRDYPDILYGTFKVHTTHLFDNNFNYRFALKLRDYVQHKNLPIITRRYTFTNMDHGIESIENITLDREELLKEDNWGKIVKNDLLTRERKIEIFPILDDLNSYCLSLYNIVFNYGVHKNWKSFLDLKNILDGIKPDEGVPNLLYFGRKKEKIISKLYPIPENIIKNLFEIAIKIKENHCP